MPLSEENYFLPSIIRNANYRRELWRGSGRNDDGAHKFSTRKVVPKLGSLGKAVVRHGRIADGRGDHASLEGRKILELPRDLAIVACWWQ